MSCVDLGVVGNCAGLSLSASRSKAGIEIYADGNVKCMSARPRTMVTKGRARP